MSVASKEQSDQKPARKKKLDLSPVFWIGINFPAWVGMLVRNRFRVGWQYIHVAIAITFWSLINSLWTFFQMLTHSWRVAKVKIEHPPIFILGHWRSGTTLLHELLSLDERHSYPTTYQCLAPNHFLRSEYIAAKMLKFFLPGTRPMDNMPIGMARPQEEEFALANLGVPSPYCTIAFPNNPPQYEEYLTLEGVPPAGVAKWKAALLKFLKQVTFVNPKRLVIKSPTHTARVSTLLEMFPGAKFVHIVRDPFVVFPSTVNLWRSLYKKHGLQRPKYVGLEDYVFRTFVRMYDKFDRDRPTIPAGDYCELRYEDMVRDPVGQLRAIYEQLNLGGFDKVEPAIVSYMASQKDYQTNKYEITDATRDEIKRRWGRYLSEYGYE